MQTYGRWSRVPDGLRTKTQWSENGYVVLAEQEPVAMISGYYGSYPLYSIEQCRAKIRRTRRPPTVYDATPANIGAALYEINKAAKRRRDAASCAYSRRQRGFAGYHKGRKNKYYAIKDQVIERCVADGIAEHMGVHRQERIDETYGGDNVSTYTYLRLYEIGGYRFHTIAPNEPTLVEEIVDLGEWMSQATPRTRHMTIADAIATLSAYLSADLSFARPPPRH